MSDNDFKDFYEKYKNRFLQKYKETGFNFEYKNKYNYICSANKKETKETVLLKIYYQELIKKGPTNYIYKQIKREMNLAKLCKSDNIIKLYNSDEEILSINKTIDNLIKLENSDEDLLNEDDNKDNLDIIILEYEKCYDNLDDYIKDEKLSENKEFFIKIVRSLANALEVLDKKRVIHRDIKPSNILIKKKDLDSDEDIEDNCIIILGDFGSSIKIDENDSMRIGTLLYTAPEILKNEKYNEKIDVWSLGVTLYQIYNSYSPYTNEYNLYSIKEKLFNGKFLYKFSGIPTLDILFKKLLEIDPEKRMSHKEFCDYVRSKEFMHPTKIYRENIYGDIYNEIKSIMQTKEYKNLKMVVKYQQEGKKEKEILENQIKRIEKLTSTPNILNIFKSMEKIEEQTDEVKYINILYYNETKKSNEIVEEINLFEEHTTGAFIFCNDLEQLKIIMAGISNPFYDDFIQQFCLIMDGTSYKNIMDFLEENNYEIYFRYKCIFGKCCEQNLYIENNYGIKEFFEKKEEVIKDFIEKYKSKKYKSKKRKIKPFPMTKLVTYEDYKKKLKYKYSHLLISSLYGALNKDLYKDNITKIINLMHSDEKVKYKEKLIEKMIKSFKTFEAVNNDNNIINNKINEEINEKIINEYTKNTFYGDLNRWLREIDILKFEEIAYFTSRLMFSLNEYGKTNKCFYKTKGKILYRGIVLDYPSLLVYERAINKKIIFTAFTSMTEKEKSTELFRKVGSSDDNFSVLFCITNIYEDKWISNGIDIQKISERTSENEILYQPFSFYIIENVEIDIKNRNATIYLKTIGKKQILEEEIKKGKNIIYNEKDKIVEAE